MRRSLRRAPSPASPSRPSPLPPGRGRSRVLAGACGLALVLSVVACGGDDGDEDSSPTTTEVAPTTEPDAGSSGDGDDDTTTTEPDATSTTADADDPGGEVPPPAEGPEVALDSAEAEVVIGQLLTRLQEVFAAAKAEGDNVETLRAGFADVFDGPEAADQYDGITEFGGLPVVRPQPGLPTVDGVEVLGGSGTCVTGTAVIDLSPLTVEPVDALQPYSFRLQPAGEGAPGPAWRLSYMGFVREGAYTENAACPD